MKTSAFAPRNRPASFLFAAILVGLAGREAAADKRVALVIGNSTYANAGTLKNPVRDARALAERLRGLGFEIESAYDQDRAGLEQALKRFSRRLAGADLALFYYAGHALQVKGSNYIVPVDAKVEQEADVRLETVDLTQPIELIQSSAKAGIVLLDACRDNPLARRIQSKTRGMSRGLAVVDQGDGEMLIVYATKPGTTADDGDGDHSPFAAALLENLGTDGIELQTMIKRVIGAVKKKTDGAQIPEQVSSLTREIYLGRPPGSPNSAPAAVPAPPPPSQNNGDAAEIAFWTSIQNSDKAEDFADYLKSYPDGRFGSLARRRMDDLKRKAQAAAMPPPATRNTPPAPTPARPAAANPPIDKVGEAQSPSGRAQVRFARADVPRNVAQNFQEYIVRNLAGADIDATLLPPTGSESSIVERMLRGEIECAGLTIDGLNRAASSGGQFKVLGNGPSSGSRTGAVICTAAAMNALSPSQRSGLQGVFVRFDRMIAPYGPGRP